MNHAVYIKRYPESLFKTDMCESWLNHWNWYHDNLCSLKQYKIVITFMHNQFILKCALLSCLFEPHITCKNNLGKSILQFWCIRNFWVCIPSCCLFASINYRFFFQFIQINSVTHCTCIKKSIRTMMLDACLRLIQYMVAI